MNKLAFEEIRIGIMFGEFTNEELNGFIESVKYARSKLGAKVKSSLRVGDRVKWNSSKTGTDVVGILEKIAKKNVVVNCGGMLWRVPANMVESVG